MQFLISKFSPYALCAMLQLNQDNAGEDGYHAEPEEQAQILLAGQQP